MPHGLSFRHNCLSAFEVMEFRMAHSASTQQMTMQVHDTAGHAYNVLVCVDENAAQGTLVITDSTAGETQKYELTRLQKSRTGKILGFKSGGATVTLTIEDAYTPPRLHLVARVFFPVVDATYTISQAEQERLMAWINTLRLGVLG